MTYQIDLTGKILERAPDKILIEPEERGPNCSRCKGRSIITANYKKEGVKMVRCVQCGQEWAITEEGEER